MSIYTLAQNGTAFVDDTAIIAPGKGSDLSNSKALKGKAKRKMITQKMVLSLIDVNVKIGHLREKKAIGTHFIGKVKYTQLMVGYTANTVKIGFALCLVLFVKLK